ncbi:MAG TPA: hypothetical protein VGU43_07125 [Thermoplasmata archaeon]|nr:hypothetical protein [Thermoplasmata archaeon]
MSGRGAAAVLAGLGGLLVILGGLIGFIAGIANGIGSHSVLPGLGGLEYGIAAIVIAVLIWMVAGFTHYARPQNRFVAGIGLLVLGLIVWFFFSGILYDIGGVLTALAGLIFLLTGISR